nr:putative nucleotidyltransferase, ribonuclease H [Tanacetum cinerariifolium]
HKNQKKSNEMYYPRFTKAIIHHFMSKDPSIPRRNKTSSPKESTLQLVYDVLRICPFFKAFLVTVDIDGQSERTIQMLEDMLRSCALEWTGNWDDYICLVEFAYNNSWHASIKCAPFKMLYGRKCRAPICWDQVGERVIEGPEMREVTNAKVVVAKEKLKEARTRQKSYADKHR